MHAYASALLAASAAIVLCLGTLHLLLTFRGPKLHPRDQSLRVRMQAVSPVLTRQTTMWDAWIGFNASHSFGAILFGLVYGYLALEQGALLFASPFLLLVGACLLAGYLALARRYWFRIPFRGIALALACYLGAVILALR
ncbi:MAG TPA: hypothetical protein VFF16_10025 [Telluria sp.]|nr:hypothetical protein [Telluria sp.]